MTNDDESLGMTILKGIGGFLLNVAKEAMDPDNMAKMQEKNERWAKKNMNSSDPKKAAAAQKISDNSARQWERINRAQATKARMEQQKAKREEWERRHSGGK